MILRRRTLVSTLLVVAALVVPLVVVVTHAAPSNASSKPVIVAGVSQWGALASQVVGSDATVVSLLTDPNADPHNHEATTGDAINVSRATIVIENGAGYDTWLNKLVEARSKPPVVINVASLLGVRAGQNPHVFYDVAAAKRFVAALAADLKRLGHFPGTQVRATQTLARLGGLSSRVAQIHRGCSGVKVAATEDVAGYLLKSMGLRVVTPESLRLAIGNSVDPSVQDLALALSQLRHHPAFLVNNTQTATPLTQEMVAQAKSSHVPVINVTETMTGTDYVRWLTGVVSKMRAALLREGCVR